MYKSLPNSGVIYLLGGKDKTYLKKPGSLQDFAMVWIKDQNIDIVWIEQEYIVSNIGH